MGRATAWTGPQPIAQGHGIVDEATDMTAFGGREKAVDVVYMGAELLSSLMQDLYKAPKAHIGDLASPHGSHAPQLQILKIDGIVALAQRPCCVPVPGLALMGNPAMHAREGLFGLASVLRPWHLARQGTIGFPYRTQRLSQWLGSMDIMAVVSGEECRETEIKACGLTRLDSDTGLLLNETEKMISIRPVAKRLMVSVLMVPAMSLERWKQ
jgi:hypothetical protein